MSWRKSLHVCNGANTIKIERFSFLTMLDKHNLFNPVCEQDCAGAVIFITFPPLAWSGELGFCTTTESDSTAKLHNITQQRASQSDINVHLISNWCKLNTIV